MFEPGERVACVDADFAPLHRTIYRALPSQDQIYTVRECSLGRTRTGGPDKGCSYRVLLVELVNDPDPYMHPDAAEELGFRSDRFAPVVSEEISAEAEIEELLDV
ncbi:hypothetical protein BH09VER1_BH09VER1_56520 [soil metagenome]